MIAISGIVKKIADAESLPMSLVRDVIGRLRAIIYDELAEGGEVRISGLCRFSTRRMKGRRGRLPNGKPTRIEARTRVRIKASDELTRSLNR